MPEEQVLYREDGGVFSHKPEHGDHAWDGNQEGATEYMYSGVEEKWLTKREFQNRHGGRYMFE